jgi:2-oxoglutarate dehydrogenase complex dehydrogenase (E1) component-like enzyme
MRTSIDARANLNLIEENYRRWQENPDFVDSGWSAFF